MTLITDAGQLADYCHALEGADYVAVDTEFMRESTYWPILCLVQVAGPHGAVAIDPLAEGMDLEPLLRVMADPGPVKVFHAARQDLEIFHRLMGRVPAPLFDTQAAAAVCGFGESVSYEVLVARLAGARIDKSSRFTDWSVRPLRKRQLDYALDDVIHLRTVYEKLAQQLADNGRGSWIEEEMAILANPETYDPDPRQSYLRIKSRSTNSGILAVLREVAAWRETEAQRRDLPRNRVLRDQALVEIAQHGPRDVGELARTRGLGQRLAEGEAGAGILAAVAQGLAVPEAERPRPRARRETPRDVGPVADLLKVLLKMKCAEWDVAQRLVASAEDVERIAAEGAVPVAALAGWRREVFGADALRLRNGAAVLAVEGGKLRLRPASVESGE